MSVAVIHGAAGTDVEHEREEPNRDRSGFCGAQGELARCGQSAGTVGADCLPDESQAAPARHGGAHPREQGTTITARHTGPRKEEGLEAQPHLTACRIRLS